MYLIASLLGIEGVALDAERRVVSMDLSGGRISMHLIVLSADGSAAPVWLDLGLDPARVHSSCGEEEGLFVCSAIGDIDGDGQPEIVCGVTRADGASLLSFKRVGDDWVKRVIAEGLDGIEYVRTICTGDVDGDGVDEILLASRPNGRVLLFDAQGDGFVQTIIEDATFGEGTTNAREVLIADVDGDGRNELLVTTARTDAVKWGSTPGVLLVFERDGDGWTRRVVDDFGGETHTRMMRVGALGNDSGPLMVVNEVGIYSREERRIVRPTRMVVHRLGRDDGARECIAEIEGAVKSRGFALGDIDGDGRNALVLGTRAVELADPSYLYAYRQTPDGAWTREEIERSGSFGYHFVELIDTDDDGVREVVASDDSRGQIKLYKPGADGWLVRELIGFPYALFSIAIHPFPCAASRHAGESTAGGFADAVAA